MRRGMLPVAALMLLATVAWVQVVESPALPSQWLPAGALLSIESKDFGTLLTDWNRSQAKPTWLKSVNHDAFAQSNLFQKMNHVYEEYGQTAGLLPGLPQLLEVAGTESAFALYDPRALQFLYITKLTNAGLTQSQLWALRDKFEQRESAGKTFYVRGEKERTVAFAFSGDYLFAATRDDLIAHALALQSGGNDGRLADEPWYATAAKSSSGRGDLRMVLNLGALVKNTYFRSYWIQRNVTDLKPFSAEVCDLDRKGSEFMERRVLVREQETHPDVPSESARAALAQLVATAPRDIGLYRAWAGPDAMQLARLIEEKLLFAPPTAKRDPRYAPQAPVEANAGSDADLETMIDEAPLPEDAGSAVASRLLQPMLAGAKVEAAIQIQSSAVPPGAAFISIPSAIGIESERAWDVPRVSATLSSVLSQRVSIGGSGVQWVTAGSPLQSPQSELRVDGLAVLFLAARGRVLYIGNDEALLAGVLAVKMPASFAASATYDASFRHARESGSYKSLMGALDSVSGGGQSAFFSGNLGSLSTVLTDVHQVDVTEQTLPDRVLQTVHYF